MSRKEQSATGRQNAKPRSRLRLHRIITSSLTQSHEDTVFFTLYIRLSKEIGVILAPNTKAHTELLQKIKKIDIPGRPFLSIARGRGFLFAAI
jgi:hypothetical protein